ncbi:MAG: hypothetical protein JJ934_19450 [Pseudomonadales bacterium]|nr:hypothetical protein [Pseudomonadales bacterium]
MTRPIQIALSISSAVVALIFLAVSVVTLVAVGMSEGAGPLVLGLLPAVAFIWIAVRLGWPEKSFGGLQIVMDSFSKLMLGLVGIVVVVALIVTIASDRRSRVDDQISSVTLQGVVGYESLHIHCQTIDTAGRKMVWASNNQGTLFALNGQAITNLELRSPNSKVIIARDDSNLQAGLAEAIQIGLSSCE